MLNLLSQRPCRNNTWLSTTGADADIFSNRISSAQALQLDDQRVALPALPGISGSLQRNANGNAKVWVLLICSMIFTFMYNDTASWWYEQHLKLLIYRIFYATRKCSNIFFFLVIVSITQ